MPLTFRCITYALAGAAAALLSIETVGAEEPSVRLITLDPGHFHASLVQKFMYPQVSPEVHVYAPAGPDLQEHLQRVAGFNARPENPTRWEEKIYTGKDFLERMLAEKAGNVVVLAGNNARKTDYVDRAVRAGFHVLADKPMAITPSGFRTLRKTMETAAQKRVLVYDIMTERYEITSILQRELVRTPEVFGQLVPGTPDEPAVVMESVHHFFKEVAGKPLLRPAWFFDARQQGEAIPDVGTHLVDLAQWECFPEATLNWKTDVKVLAAHRWPTKLTTEQFKRVTGLDRFPEFLNSDVGVDGMLNVSQNGDVRYALKGVNVKVTALWRFEAPPGAKDTHFAMLRGTGTALTIRQGEAQKFQPTLYVENRSQLSTDRFESTLRVALAKLCETWPGLELKKANDEWEIVVPPKYSVGHEAHFAQVTEKYLGYLARGEMPACEIPNLLTKYYTTTEAYRLAQRSAIP